MKASLRSVRIAPKKAALVAKLVRGLSAAEAMHVLERTNKKAARLFEDLLRSAMANASHNDRQDPQVLVIRSLIVNQGQAYHRGVPMARGRVRPMRKFMSHIHITLGIAGDDALMKDTGKTQKTEKTQKTQKKVVSSGSSESSASSAPSGSSASGSSVKTPKTSSQNKPTPVKRTRSTSTEKRKDTPKQPSDVPAS